MSEEEIKKEQEASKMEKVQSKENAQVDKPKVDVNLEESTKPTETPPKESKRQYSKKVQDYKTITSEAEAKGIDLNNQEGVPLLNKDKEEIINRFKPMTTGASIVDLSNRINTYAQPELKKVPELDQKRLMQEERKIRRARLGDALYAFGEGLQGKTANREAMATTRLQRKKDQEFQDYLTATEQNRTTRNAWNKMVSDETLKWLDEQANNQRLDQFTREKMQAAADQYRQNMAFKEEQLAQGKQIADDRNATSIKAAAIRASSEKDDDKIEVQTSKQLHKLTPAEYAKIKRDVLSNIDKYKDRYKDWFIEKPEMTKDKYGFDVPTGKTTIELRPQIKDDELVGAYLEEQDNPLLPKPGSAAYFDRYRKEKGLPTSDVPVSQTIKQGATPRPQTQKPKADPLGLGL